MVYVRDPFQDPCRYRNMWIIESAEGVPPDFPDTTRILFQSHPGGGLRCREVMQPLLASEAMPEAFETNFCFF